MTVRPLCRIAACQVLWNNQLLILFRFNLSVCLDILKQFRPLLLEPNYLYQKILKFFKFQKILEDSLLNPCQECSRPQYISMYLMEPQNNSHNYQKGIPKQATKRRKCLVS